MSKRLHNIPRTSDAKNARISIRDKNKNGHTIDSLKFADDIDLIEKSWIKL